MAKVFFDATGKDPDGLEIRIVKRIPSEAGLGGGSADAAAVLCGLNRLYNADLSYETLCNMAVKLGADVPFFIKGGCQRATGIGEVLQQYKPLERVIKSLLLPKCTALLTTINLYFLTQKRF